MDQVANKKKLNKKPFSNRSWIFGINLTGRFSDLVQDEALRRDFVDSSAQFLIKNKFDGLGINTINII